MDIHDYAYILFFNTIILFYLSYFFFRFIFQLFKSILYFVNWISLHFFISYKIVRYFMLIDVMIEQWWVIRTSFSCARFTSLHIYSHLTSYLPHLFLCLLPLPCLLAQLKARQVCVFNFILKIKIVPCWYIFIPNKNTYVQLN